MFVPLDAATAAKVYSDAREARLAAKNQRKAYKAGIAPQVLSRTVQRCSMGKLHMYDKYCIFKYYNSYDSYVSRKFGYFYITEIVESPAHFKTSKEERSFKNKVYRLGLSTVDLSERNLGRRNGKLVMIDFGHIST